MLWKLLMKKPVLTMGLLMMLAFLLDLYRMRDGKSLFYREDFIAHSCKAVIVKLERRVPDNWKVYCEHNNLSVEIKYQTPELGSKNAKAISYRRLANDLSFIAQNSPEETLMNVFIVRVRSQQPGLIINAVSEGQYLSKLATMRDPDYISEHLKKTVQVKESIE